MEITAPITTKLSGNQRIFGIVILQSALLYRVKQVSTASAAQDRTMKGKWYLLSQEVMNYRSYILLSIPAKCKSKYRDVLSTGHSCDWHCF